MTEKEVLDIVLSYLSAHWKEVILALVTAGVVLVSSTWIVAKLWYSREIGHLKNQLNSMKQVHAERIGVLNDKVNERTNYAKGMVELAEQRVLAVEHDRLLVTRSLTENESELVQLRAALTDTRELLARKPQEAAELQTTEKLTDYLLFTLNSKIYIKKGTSDKHPAIARLDALVRAVELSYEILSVITPAIGAITEIAMEAIIKSEKGTEALAKFHHSYYKSIKNILTPIADERAVDEIEVSAKHMPKDMGWDDVVEMENKDGRENA